MSESKINVTMPIADIANLVGENEKLRAEVERLRERAERALSEREWRRDTSLSALRVSSWRRWDMT